MEEPINGQYDVTELERLFVTDAEEVTVDGDLELWVSSEGRGNAICDCVPRVPRVRWVNYVTAMHGADHKYAI